VGLAEFRNQIIRYLLSYYRSVSSKRL